MKLYRIKDWDRCFENHRTRILDAMHWVPIPNKLDGDGYTTLVTDTNGASLYGAWVALTLVASRCRPRGTLVRAGGAPHTAITLSAMTKMPAKILQAVLDKASSPEVGWLEVIAAPADAQPAHDPAHDPADETAHGDDNERRKEGIEGKKESICADAPIEKFPPGMEESHAYGASIGLTLEDCNAWRDHFLANGWTVGKARTPMKDWQATMRTWRSNKPQYSHQANGLGRSVSVNELRTIHAAKQSKRDELSRRYAHESPLGYEWSDLGKRKEYNDLGKEMKELTDRIANYA